MATTTLGSRLKAERKRLGMSADALAKILEVTPAAIYMIERDAARRPRSVKKLAKALGGVNPAWLEYGDYYAKKYVRGEAEGGG